MAQTVGITGDNVVEQCETGVSYTVSMQNDSGNPLTDLVVTARLGNLTGFSYAAGTATIDVGGAPICSGAGDNDEPVVSGTDLIWNIDTRCPNNSPFTLANGQTLNITFDLAADCTAVSGSLDVRFDYEINGTPMFDETEAYSIQVLPGGVTIVKTPNVIPQYLGEDVTWTLTIENTGLGAVRNVVVTDELEAGLRYVSSNPPGSNAGQTTTWGTAEIPEFASLEPGDTTTIDITATVVSCQDLEDAADVRWGCDAVTDCFNTATDGGTANASVQRIVTAPLLDYSPPDVSFTYCEDYVDVAFPISNIGDGTAHDLWLFVDFGGLTVSNVSAGATYNGTDKRFELANPLAPGGSYDLSFRLSHASWCGGGFPAGDLLWQPLYRDDCGYESYAPVELGTIDAPTSSTDLSVSVGGAAEAIQIGDQVTYNVSSTYSGPLACGSGGSVGAITVVDTVPDGFTVVDAGGGTWVPGAGGTAGTVTWTYTPPAALNTSITLRAPDRTQCETYCFTTFVNSVAASGTDCCGCVLDASDAQTTAIECEELVDSEKSAIPTPGLRCDAIQYTNVYVFADNAALDSVDFSQLIFREDADSEQEYDPGSLMVTLSGAGDTTACAASGLTDTTPGAGGNLVIDFSNCSAYGSVRDRTLTIVYRLTLTEATASACSASHFYSWSSLDLNLSTGSQCLQDGMVYETTVVSVQPPAMSLFVTGLDEIAGRCETRSITMDLTQTSDVANPRDVRLVLSGLNYYAVNPAATVCGGSVAPTSCMPALVGDDYVWYFADGFTGPGQDATLQLDVQKRCTGAGDLAAIAYYDDNCSDNATYDDTCSTSATETPALLLSGDLLIEETPAVYYATTNTVQWRVYLTNRGSGAAYNVWVDDLLGAGLDYVSAVVDDMTGVTITADQDHNGGPINGASITIVQMAAGERREITVNALLVGCGGLTNDVSASWGCVGVDCQVAVTDNATVEIPAPLLINTSAVPTPLTACSTTDGTITLRNAGQTTLYNLQATETLAPGLLYIPGTTRWRLNGGAWNGPAAAYDSSPTTSPLQWTSAQIPALAVVNPGDVIEIDFDMEVNCPLSGGDVAVSTQFETPCGQVSTSAESRSTVSLREPDVRIAKTRVDEPVGCGDLVEWTITVENLSGYTLPVIWVEDTLGAAYTYQSSVGDPPFTADDGTFDGTDKVTWELRNVNHNDTATLMLRANLDSFPCSPDLDNTVRAWWGCGAADGSSATKPGADPPDDTLCLTASGVSDTDTPTREPSIGFLDISVNPLSVDSCNDNTQLTVTMKNTGPTDAENVDLVVTLPPGITYNAGSSTVTCGGVTNPAADPAISGNQLIYYDVTDNAAGKANNLCDTVEAAGGNDTVVLIFSVRSNCLVSADMAFDLYYYDCCEDTQYSTTASETMTALYPDLAVTKTPVSAQVDCSSNQAWSVTVTNNGTGNAQVVRIEDTLGDWIDYVGSSPAATAMGGQVYGWEINNLGPGDSQTFTVTGQLNPDPPQSDCTALLRQNNVRAIWGCGVAGDAADNDPTTTVYDCTHDTWSNAPAATLQMPDLVVTSITPVVACNADGSSPGAITVQVQNQGDGNSVDNFTVEITDGKGWTGTGTYAGNVPPGGSVDVTIDTSGWSPDCQPCAAPYTFNVANVDLGDTVCECREDNNTLGPVTYTPPIPDLVVSDIDFANVSCSNDNCSGSIVVIVTNVGCAGAANFQVSLTTDGCLDFSNQTVTSLAAGANTIVSFPIGGSWSDCTVQDCQFTAEVDPTDVACECDGTNNDRIETYSSPLPDLVVTDIDFSNIFCAGDDGSDSVAVTVQNQGFGSAVGFQVSLATDGCLSFGNQVVLVPLDAGASTTVVFPVTSPWANCADCGCQFTATVDPVNTVCECDGTNNQRTEEYTQSLPDLRVNSVTPSVISGTVTVNVSNIGCGTASGAVMRLASDCGISFTDQTVDLAASSNRDIVFDFTPPALPYGCAFTAIVDPDNALCECSGTNNAATGAFSGLSVAKSVVPTTNVAYRGIVTYTVVLTNTGTVSDTNVLFSDTLPTVVEFGSWLEQPAGTVHAGNAITWTGTLTNNTAITFTFTATHTGGFGDAVTNTAHFTGMTPTGSDEATFAVEPGPTAWTVYLPLVCKGFVSAPDLVVEGLVATSSAVTVTIRNQGTAPATDAFWVDVYFSPTETPSVNKPWDAIASHGAAWGVTTDIPAGDILVLTTGGDYYFPEYSSTLPLPAWVDVYALVDSINQATTYGAVRESNESNNLFGPVVSIAVTGPSEQRTR